MGQSFTLDGALRRRIYLFRHGAVDYVGPDGRAVEDADSVRLNEKGRAQADAMAALFRDVEIDRAACSSLPRTRETGERVLSGHGLELEAFEDLREIRRRESLNPVELDLVHDLAYGHFRAHEPGHRYLGGEPYADFVARVTGVMAALLADDGWRQLAVFAHGGTNAAVLGWALGLGERAFGVIDQATCCVNIIDVDTDADDGAVRRFVVRAMNVTVDDAVKNARRHGDLEKLARYFLDLSPDHAI